VSPELLEVWGGQVNLEEWVSEMLTEEGKSVVGLEQWVADEFVKAQNVDSVDVVVGGGVDVAEGVHIEDILVPQTVQTELFPQKVLLQTSLVVKGLGSSACCEQCNCDKSLHY